MGIWKTYFREDIQKYYRIGFGSKKPPLFSKIRLWISHFGFHCVAVYRLGSFASQVYARNKIVGLPVKVIHFILDYFVRAVYHVAIDADIGPGFYVGHIGNIYIGPTKIGANFSVTHNVTIGVGHIRGKEAIPTIGNNVWIGTGSVISGACKVGDNVTIASGSILTRDLPDGCLAAGNPARIVLINYNNTHLLGFAPAKPIEDNPDENT